VARRPRRFRFTFRAAPFEFVLRCLLSPPLLPLLRVARCPSRTIRIARRRVPPVVRRARTRSGIPSSRTRRARRSTRRSPTTSHRPSSRRTTSPRVRRSTTRIRHRSRSASRITSPSIRTHPCPRYKRAHARRCAEAGTRAPLECRAYNAVSTCASLISSALDRMSLSMPLVCARSQILECPIISDVSRHARTHAHCDPHARIALVQRDVHSRRAFETIQCDEGARNAALGR
jgi:hypothetical protein